MKHRKIEALTCTLLDYGYHSQQIKQIVNEARESSHAGKIPEDAVIEALEAYVEFATKCKNKGSNPR